jgi:glycine/sarcosine N-methyltransferase
VRADRRKTVAEEYRDLAEHYTLLFPLNDRQRVFFEHLVATGPAGSVLDVGCGTGEHLSWFSARGLRAYGLEPDARMFQELERRRWPGVAPTLVQAGVEALPGALGGNVDLVLCLGNTLTHLPDRPAAQRAVRGMAEVLAPGGRLVVQCVNFDRILAEGRAAFPVIERTRPDGGRVSFFRESDLAGLPERVIFRTRLVTPGGEQQASWPLVPLRLDELALYFIQAGLTGVQEFGDYDRSPFTGTSPALIVAGERTPRSSAGPAREAS